ncbi:MAG: MBL fold metallo-hydrolase [Chitinophagales bacterium]|nr:MBL fold metallo-hydrolase [Chitinophagales bacterium]
MTLSFHGATRTVTGSKHLLQLADGTKILLDCGMFQGNPKEADELNRDWGFEPREIDFLILSHAHVDHCGLIPKLIADGYAGKVYCTPATYDLARILLLDSARIQEQDVYYHNKKRLKRGEPPIKGLYDEADVNRALKEFIEVGYGQEVVLKEGVSFHFTDVGHIIGSAAVHLKIQTDNGTKTLTFSGDVGRYNDELLRAPETFPQADYLILESTYGDSLHEDISIKDQKLLDCITHTCVEKKGRLIIPAFSVGRTQELIYALNRLDVSKSLPPIDFFVDSPLSVEATGIMKQHQQELNERFKEFLRIDKEPFEFKRLHYITDAVDSKALNARKGPCVIISASGMADAGRVKHHIKHAISDPRNTILFVGYCEPNSLGGKLMRNYREVTLFGEPFQVKAEIQSMRSMSAHGDYEDLCQFIACQQPALVKQLFLVHGEYDTQLTFKSKLLRKGFPQVEIPGRHQIIELIA